MPAILLIRHAQSSFGAQDYDVLSDIGCRQAAALGLRRIEATRVVCGSARRHRDTARGAGHEGEIEIDPRWDEYDADDILEQYASTALRLSGNVGVPVDSRAFQDALDPALVAWIVADRDGLCAEPWSGFLARVSSALDDLTTSTGPGETVQVFTSAGPIAAACMMLCAAGSDAFLRLNRVQVNTGITKVVHGLRGTSLIAVNDHAHLEGGGGVQLTYR